MSRCMMFRIESAIVPINRKIPNIAMTAIIALSSFSNVTSKKNLLFKSSQKMRKPYFLHLLCGNSLEDRKSMEMEWLH